ncbi:unnamed protein product, partial [Musa hybrid cultivar]
IEYEREREGEGKRSQIERRLESFSRKRKDNARLRWVPPSRVGIKPKRKPALTIYMKTLGSSHNKVRFFMCLRFFIFAH